ncbi:MAG TPA: MYXO-CTERM sorting domain-containing protein [Archangium sp.]|jgi:MYXO-CTERM domain-containing protein|uniref:MYXO-CTERM sorting domain-containing protein n=1 Tax=Archangium sp. TaxID=1872627 RepID=UPI002ED8B6F3
MVPTGSIFGRSWRTRWSTRLRLVALSVVAGLVLLGAASAHADWRTNVSQGTFGRPLGAVELWSPGTFSVGTTNGAVLFEDGGTSPSRSLSGTSVGTYYEASDDCFISVDVAGNRTGFRSNTSPCVNNVPFIMTLNGGSEPVLRVREARGGGAAAISGSGATFQVFFADAGMSGGDSAIERNIEEGYFFNGSLGVQRVGNTLYAAVGAVDTDGVVIWYSNGNEPGADMGWPVSGSGAGMVLAIDTFSPDGLTAHAVVGTEKGFLRSTLKGGQSTLSPVQWLEPGRKVTSLSMNVEAGGTNGHGFGMALVSLPDGSHAVASAVPMVDPAQAGSRWVFRPLPMAGFSGATLRDVSCTGASDCVISAERSGVGTLFLYSNAAKPRLSTEASLPDGSVVLDENSERQLTFSAVDPDGDPVLVAASASRGLPGAWTLTQVDAGVDGGWLPGDPVVVKVSSGAVCESREVGAFKVLAADGLAAHDVTWELPVYVKHTQPPAVPSVSRSKLQLVAGETDPLRFEVGAPVGACALTGFHWSEVSAPVGLPAPTLVQDGSTALLTAPPNLCVEAGANFTYQLVVNDAAGLKSSPAHFDVRVAPWGRPRESFVGTEPVRLVAGQSRVLAPEQSVHVCADAAGFPGVETTWLLDGTLVEDGGITVRDVASGTAVSRFPVRAAGLQLETRDCLDPTRLRFTAVNRTRTTGGLSSEPSTREVVIETRLTPPEQGMLGLQRENLSPEGTLTVRLVPELNCLERRPELFADLQVARVDGSGSVRRERVRVPGSWDVDVAPGCQGGRFRVTGALVGEAGTHSAETSLEVDTPTVPAGLAALPPTSLVATCEGAQATVTQTFPAGTCQTPDVTWTQVSGPPLAQASLKGNAVRLATRDTGLETLVGESVVVKVTANGGPGNEASIEHSLPITVEPFVRVRRRTEVPAASETGFVGVSVELRNNTACGVKGVSYVERLEGLTYVEGSARFDGQPVAASWADGALTVTGLSFEAEGTGTLTYVARPHLVGERRMEGEARLNGVLVSIHEDSGPSVPVSGCGCTSSGQAPVLLALGALAWAVRRRRPTGRS